MKFNRIAALAVLTFFTLLICCPLLFYISDYYADFVWLLYGFENKPVIDNQALALCFDIFKGLIILVFAWVILIWVDFFNSRKRKATLLIIKIAESLGNSLSENRQYFLSLERRTRFFLCAVLVVQFLAYLYFLLAMPLQYDEWFSFRYFSRNGFWVILSNYEVPNNHIFYNLFAGFFVKLPFDPEVTMRLPSLLASMITTWYFFKLCKACFKDGVSILLLLFVLTSYPYIVYSFEARGYSFINLFCILLMYFSYKLCKAYERRFYRTGLIMALWLGMWTVPTFIYPAFSIMSVLTLYVLFQKKGSALRLFIKDVFVAVILVVLSYVPVILFNSASKLFNPNGGATRFWLKQPNVVEVILKHLKSVCEYLFYREEFLPVISVLVLIGVIFYLSKKGNDSFIPFLSAAMFFSPLAILVLHRVIPFERIWLFLIFPTAICLGCVAHIISELLDKKIPFVSASGRSYVNALFVASAMFLLARFPLKHQYFAYMDFAAEDLRRRYINAVAGNIWEIGLTKSGDEYYSADLIWNYCLKNNPKREIKIDELVEIKDQDILVIHIYRLNDFKDKLSSYKLLLDYGGRIFIYGKSSLF
jgi:hypothetical protein